MLSEKKQSIVTILFKNGGKAIAVATDVTKVEQVKALVDGAVKSFGRIEVIINNAGLVRQSPLDRLKIDEGNQMSM